MPDWLRRKPYVRATTNRALVVQRPRKDVSRFSPGDRADEADVLCDLAEATALTDPWTAAQHMFGGAE